MVTFEQSTPVLATTDYPRAKTFWRDKLGFTVQEEGGDPPRFGIFQRGRAIVYVDGWQEPSAPQSGWTAYFHVSDLDQAHADHAAAGLEPGDIRETVYGMREFEISDPDGHILCFGADMPDGDA